MSNRLYTVINNDFVLQSEAQIHVSDLSIQRGYGIFDYFKVLDFRPVFLEDHLDRFCQSASTMNLPLPYPRVQLTEMIYEIISKNNLPNAGIRITLTGGYANDGYTVSKPNLIITQSPFAYDPVIFEKGIRLITNEHQRQLPQVKTIDYLHAIYMQPAIKEANADDVLYHNNNTVAECPRANFFIVKNNGEVVTAAHNILKGITRKKILSFDELPIREDDISLNDVAEAREAFITSTTKYVLPVLSIDGKQVGDGKPGEITSIINGMLQQLYKQ